MNNFFDKRERETPKLIPLIGRLMPLKFPTSLYHHQIKSPYDSSSLQNLCGRESLLVNHLLATCGKITNSVSPASTLAVQKLEVGYDDVYVMDEVLVTDAAGRKELMPGLDSVSGSGGGITTSSSRLGNRFLLKDKEIGKVRDDFGHTEGFVHPLQFAHGKGDMWITSSTMILNKPEVHSSVSYTHGGTYSLSSSFSHQINPRAASASNQKEILYSSTHFAHGCVKCIPLMEKNPEAHSSMTSFDYSPNSAVPLAVSGSTHIPSSAGETPTSTFKIKLTPITLISKSEDTGKTLPSNLTSIHTQTRKSENNVKTLPSAPISTQIPTSKSENTSKTLPSSSSSTLKAESSRKTTNIPTQDWTPLDDGIEVSLPFNTEKPLSREEIDTVIHNVRYHSAKAMQRLPVFSEMCLEEKHPSSGNP